MSNNDWMIDAACKGHPNPDLWFPNKSGPAGNLQAAQAARICASCPVQLQCEQLRRRSGSEFGVWGGRVYRSKQYGSTAWRPPLAHGTEGRYNRHLRDKEPPCHDCRVAASRARAVREARAAGGSR